MRKTVSRMSPAFTNERSFRISGTSPRFQCAVGFGVARPSSLEGQLEMQKILVIDDDVRFLEMMEVILRSEGFEPHVCADPNAVAAILETLPPDAIILDIRMPGQSGWSLLDVIRSASPKTGIIVCSAAVREVLDRQRALEASGISVLLKPFDVQELLDQLRKTLSTAA